VNHLITRIFWLEIFTEPAEEPVQSILEGWFENNRRRCASGPHFRRQSSYQESGLKNPEKPAMVFP
jgi:hypothetical protein